jgi:hypothetical protein
MSKETKPWKNSAAKKHLRQLLKAGEIDELPPREVFKLSSLFEPYKDNFASKVRSLKLTMKKEKNQSKPNRSNSDTNNNGKDPPKWRYSEAKKVLTVLLESDSQIYQMEPEQVHKLSTLFEQYEIARFTTYLKNLKASLEKNKDLVRGDEQALVHDKRILPTKILNNRGKVRWETSDAKKLMREDVKNKVHKIAKPKEFQKTRPEYNVFDLEEFRKHIYQEEYAQSARSYWLHKKETKKQYKQDVNKAAKEIINNKGFV